MHDWQNRLSKLKSILAMERNRVIESIRRRGTFRGEFLACKSNIGVIRTRKVLPLGTLLGVAEGDDISELGYVIASGRYTLLKLISKPDEKELNLVELESLISYDLQIQAIEMAIENSSLPEVTSKSVDGKVEGLDEWQSSAVLTSLELEDNEVLLVVGPPGTGKTTFISKAAKLASSSGSRVLITSHTNRAVDNVIERQEKAVRVGNPSKLSPAVLKFSLERMASKAVEDEENASDAEELAELTARKARKIEREMLRIVNDAVIVGATLIKCALFPMADQDFDIVFIDEASQALISAALLGMERGRKYVLVGDPYQLPPVLSTDASAYSAFNFFHDWARRAIWLRNHYRSNSEIIGFVAKHVYGHRIRPHESCKNVKLEIIPEGKFAEIIDPGRPIVFVSACGREEGKGSKLNEVEARVVVEICRELVSNGVNVEDIGIITPYVRQRKLISEMINRIGLNTVEVNTVDAFQGREKDVIIFSTTAVKDLRFASDFRRFNVALTRARKKFIVIGNEKAFRVSSNRATLLYSLYMHARSRGSYFKLM
ncbi:DEAD/DEAH box helicase [Archaeoglobus veneficus]|uniref:AAA ATPase n=1 Tax=Archaeoglobus veneficus (strain DSM 11195 / SNP6) TaxID=693661 RepID=F2KNT4_ARCVS|nr:AAA domain-containing protein [Archaeoglobus veneficus]AEA47411.1 AAA ATPase [Archaeoglobus veneficus SNP6]